MTEPVIAYAIRICNKFRSDVIMWFYYSVSLHVPTRYELQDWRHQPFYFPMLCLLAMAACREQQSCSRVFVHE